MLHFGNDLLVIKPFLILIHNLVLKILSRLCPSLCIPIPTLLLSLSLLVPYHLLDLCSPQYLLLPLQLKHLLVLSLLSLVHGHFLFNLVHVLLLSLPDCCFLSVSHLLIVLHFQILLMSLLLKTFLLLALVVLIAFSHLNNVVSPFLGFINLLSRLRLFVLQQLDPVGQ